ncbi:BTB/POZ and MATH domain-containing protein 2-like [Panicum miliaceum]|uniref:BTB/POZ and MATH domain-containing protein 2-like n=1 Tax=Panicum miliaceum TaxID=4540 RepID=A0A3L6TA40_PANMI|nr:BTB/POZ and MATH domain-containing protein 2-like [Panicum miliaceum]
MSPSPIVASPSSSFASLRARQVTSTHLLRIDGHKAADRMVLAGESINSRTFSAGGRNSDDRSERGRTAAVKLRLKDRGSMHDAVTAAYRLSILDRDGNPAYSYAVGPHRFDADSRYSHHVNVLATPEERRAARQLVEDDSLTVRCDISVTRFDKESRIKWYLRKLLD